MKLISIVTPCLNEEKNIEDVYQQVREIFRDLPAYSYEHIFIDNSSSDGTVLVLKEIASRDKNVKIIENTRNFGPVRSPQYGMYQASGDAVVLLVADLQDPPGMIRDFLRFWEEGYKIVIGVKASSREDKRMYFLRRLFYHTLNKVSDVKLITNFTGFGLYDRMVIDLIRGLNEPYPYFRGLIAETGIRRKEIEYVQPERKKGSSKSGFYNLYDWAMLGFVSHSKIPLRLAGFLGFLVSILSLLTAFGYLVYKLLYWNNFQLGIAPMVIGLFFFGGIQLLFLGIIGEYIAAIFTYIRNRPLVFEKGRTNFTEVKPGVEN